MQEAGCRRQDAGVVFLLSAACLLLPAVCCPLFAIRLLSDLKNPGSSDHGPRLVRFGRFKERFRYFVAVLF